MGAYQGHLRTTVVVASAGAAAIHLAAVHSHLMEYVPAAAFMLLSGIAQLAFAFAVARTVAPERLARIGAIGNAAIVALWVASRTTGLPLAQRPWAPEHMHAPDQVATLLEGLLVVACAAQLRPAFAVRARLLRALALIGACASVFSTSHEPARERLVVIATLALATGGIALWRAIVAQQFGRGHEAQVARPRFDRYVVGARASAGARS
jgi:hypothetical protein